MRERIDAIICEIYIGMLKNNFAGKDNNNAADGNGVATTTDAHVNIVSNNEYTIEYWYALYTK